nr:reverse transcriptase domain-containing protein [Tanacetum cinerariifolium]
MPSFNSIVRAFASLGHDLGNSYVYDPNPNSFDCSPNSYHPPHPTYETYSYDSYGNNSQFGYDCQPQFPLNFESEPGYNENYTSYPYDSLSLPQQYICCTRCGGPHETCQYDQLIFDEPYCKHCGGPHLNYQCQPMNQDSYNSNSLNFDQTQPPQSPVIHQPAQELSIQEMEDLKQQYLDELKRLSNLKYRDEIKIAELKENFNGMSIEIQKKEKLLQQEQWAYLNTHPLKRLNSFCYDDDDDEDYTSTITPDEPVLSTEEPDNSLSMGDEHLDTTPATESDEFIKSSVEKLIPIPIVAKVNSNSSTPAISSEVAELKDMVRALLLDKKNQPSAPATSPTPALIKAVESNCVTCGGSGTLPGNTVTNPKEDLKGITTRSGVAYKGPTIPTQSKVVKQAQTPSPTPAPIKAVEPNCVTCGGSGTLLGNTITNPKEDLKGITTRSGVAYQGPTIPTPSKVAKQGTEVTKDQVQTSNSQSTTPVQPTVTQSESETPVFEPVVAPVSAPMPNLKPSIPYPSRRDNERRHDQANEQIEKFYEIIKDMSFEISFTDALILMPKFASTLKALIGNKEKMSEMARTPMNEHCSVVILNKLPKKLEDPDKFLIPCEFLGMNECLALADLGVSINLMPLSVWKGLSLPELTPTCMTLDLTDRTESQSVLLKMSKLKLGEANSEASPQPEVYGLLSSCLLHPTPSDDPIVSTTSPTLTSFGDSDFLLFEEADAFLAILNSDPLPPLSNHEQFVPSFKEELKAYEAKMIKSSIDEPPEVELKDLPPYLEYAFLEGDNKLPIIIAKELRDEEKSALIKVLKPHKQAIAWKLSDIQGINPEFYTHKILMEEDYKPAV